MSTSPIWRDETSGLLLHRAEDGSLEIEDGTARITIPEAAVSGFSQAVSRVQAADRPAISPGDGSYFEVFYVHEYRDDSGEIVSCPELGDHDGDWRYTWDEVDLEGVLARAKSVGSAIDAFHNERALLGESLDEESRHAWISVFRMPEDERVWKGPWDELEDELDDLLE